jgi:DNA invertase Pin-like site-specific DNA recombinase
MPVSQYYGITCNTVAPRYTVRVIGYIRVSTEEQASGGHSLDSQRARVAAYCGLYGHEVVEVIEDAGYSAKSLDRPGVQRVLDAVRAREIEGVVVTRLDRLTRRMVDLVDYVRDCEEKSNGRGRARSPAVALMSVEEQLDTSTPAGIMMLHLLGTLAEWERGMISQRVRETMRSMSRRGLRTGQIPHGFCLAADGKALEPDPAEQAAAQLARDLRAGGASLRAIGRALEEAGHANKAGGRWAPTSVKYLLGSKS